MPTNIVFDFGAVLFTWRPELLVQALFPAEAATPAAARQLARDIFHHQDWQSFDCGTLELPSVIERTASRMHLPLQSMHAMMSTIPEHLAPIPETLALLERLLARRERTGGIRLYFLSNMPAPFARVIEQRHVFLDWFDGGIFSGDVKLIKPQPEIFKLLETRYALDPGRTVFVDDLPANVHAACARGWSGLHFESAAQLEPELERHLA